MPKPVHVTFLGGLGEIGRNCTCFELDGKILVVDCGIMFPTEHERGVDQVLPDLRYLLERPDDVVGVVATHGHEDHVGALPHLLSEAKAPLYGSAFSLGIAGNRIGEAGLEKQVKTVAVKDGETHQIGPFEVEFIPTTHSIPGAFCLAIKTPQGVIVHSGDFKLDPTPVDGRVADLPRLREIAETDGVRLMLCDSTNAEEHGHSMSESAVGPAIDEVFEANADNRIIVASFASHIHRVQQIADAAIRQGRKVATLGLSMRRNVRMATEMGLLDIPARSLIDIEDAENHPPEKICVISTGTQAEPRSALTLMSLNDNRWIKVGPGDTVIVSADAIPGNEVNVGATLDGLMRLGAEVVYEGVAPIHATGHAQRDDLIEFHQTVKPEWFVPVHGELRHLLAHQRLAIEELDMPEDRTRLCDNGTQLVLDDAGLDAAEPVSARRVYVDGIVGDVGPSVLRDRKLLGDEGFVAVTAAVDLDARVIASGPEIITRGWVYGPESEDLLDEMGDVVEAAVGDALDGGEQDPVVLERLARRAAGKLINERTRRRPIVLAIVMSV